MAGIGGEAGGFGAGLLAGAESAGTAVLEAGEAALVETVTQVAPGVIAAATPAIEAAMAHVGQAVAAKAGLGEMEGLAAGIVHVALTAFLNHLLAAGHLPSLGGALPVMPPPNAA